MEKKLPIFDIILNDEDLSQGVGRISLVDEPAIGVDWITLRKQPKMIMAKKAPKSVLAKRECLGCPPNGDGTTAKGEPDRRCKGDGAGKEGAGGKGGVKSPKNTSIGNPDTGAVTKQEVDKNYNTISSADAKASGKMPGIYSKKEQNVSIKSTDGQNYVLPLSWAKAAHEKGLFNVPNDGGRRMTTGSLLTEGQLNVKNITWNQRSDGKYVIGVYHTAPGFGGGTEYIHM